MQATEEERRQGASFLFLLRFRSARGWRRSVLSRDRDWTAARRNNVRRILAGRILAVMYLFSRPSFFFLGECRRLNKQMDTPCTKAERKYIHEDSNDELLRQSLF